MNELESESEKGNRDGTVMRSLASHQFCMGLIPGLGVMRIEFVAGPCPCSERLFSGYSGFPLSSKINQHN